MEGVAGIGNLCCNFFLLHTVDAEVLLVSAPLWFSELIIRAADRIIINAPPQSYIDVEHSNTKRKP